MQKIHNRFDKVKSSLLDSEHTGSLPIDDKLFNKKFPHVKTVENLSAKPLNDLIAKQEHRKLGLQSFSLFLFRPEPIIILK